MYSHEEMYRACVDSTKRFVSAAGFEDIVLGLSGGIDSALVATIACDALGSAHVHGVLLPGPYSSAHSVEDALSLASNLGVSVCTIPIDEPYEAFSRVIGEATGEALSGLASENTQARCRMVCLMALSNSRGWMMLNTGNKSEAAMGYSTLYGDTAGAFAPIGGIYKSDVYALARYRNARAIASGETAPIPESIISKPPSAELSPDQQDEVSMGIAYAELDPILVAYVEEKKSLDELIDCGFDREQAEMVVKRYGSYAFKRAMEPDFPGHDFYL